MPGGPGPRVAGSLADNKQFKDGLKSVEVLL
jgi:hypothetical protein